MKKLILDEEDTTVLDEALPRDLAKAYRRNTTTPRDSSRFSGGYGGITDNAGGVRDTTKYSDTEPGRDHSVDFQNSDYKPLTPDEAIALFKAGNSRNVQAVFDGQLANTYTVTDDSGKKTRKYDFKAERNYKSDKDKYRKENGNIVDNTMLLTPKEFYNNADAIYLVNEVTVDPDLMKSRSENPESIRNWHVRYEGDNPNLYTTANPNAGNRKSSSGFSAKRSVPDDIVFSDEANRIVYVPGVYGGTGDAKFWLDRHEILSKRWGEEDGDTIRAYDAYMLAKTGKREYIDYKEFDKVKNAKARLRYMDSEKALKKPINDLKQALNNTNQIKKSIERVTANKAAYSSPEQRQNRQADIQYYINRYKSYIMDYLRQLEQYEAKLDDLDARDLEEIKKYDDKIAELTKNLNDAKQVIDNAKNGGKLLPKYNKENIVNQVVDKLDDIDVTESLHEDLEAVDESQLSSLVRNIIGACWADVDKYSSYLITVTDSSDEELKNTIEQLINNIYITIGILEGLLPDYDPNSDVLDDVEIPDVQATDIEVEEPVEEELEEAKSLDEIIDKELNSDK